MARRLLRYTFIVGPGFHFEERSMSAAHLSAYRCRHAGYRVACGLASLALPACSFFRAYELDKDPDGGVVIAEAGARDSGFSNSSPSNAEAANDEINPTSPGATSAPSSGGECVAPVPLAQGECPPACTGGCQNEGRLCLIQCASADSCAGARIACPTNRECEITCDNCAGAHIECPGPYACRVGCDGEESCKNIRLDCAAASCELQCQGKQACAGASVRCDDARCPSGCSPLETQADVQSLECLAACAK